jgi:hypothetical protein
LYVERIGLDGINLAWREQYYLVEFVVLAEGKEIWRSGKITKADGARPAKVDVTGVQRPVLRVETEPAPGAEVGGGRGARNRVQAAWVEAVLS